MDWVRRINFRLDAVIEHSPSFRVAYGDFCL
jgi:hypothetical protein